MIQFHDAFWTWFVTCLAFGMGFFTATGTLTVPSVMLAAAVGAIFKLFEIIIENVIERVEDGE